MAWCLVHWTPSHWAQVRCSGREVCLSSFYTCVNKNISLSNDSPAPLSSLPVAECTGGQEYQECGTPCPRTCDNYQLDFACELSCFPGCYCPNDTVLHEGECIDSSLCPGTSMSGLLASPLSLSPSLPLSNFPLFISLSHSNFTHSCTSTHHTYFTFLFSSATCSGGKEWQDCGTACPLTCDNYNTTIICTTQCVSGCFCPQGMVDHNGECIAPSDCVGMLSTLVCYLYWY